jgi:hypothetical protein
MDSNWHECFRAHSAPWSAVGPPDDGFAVTNLTPLLFPEKARVRTMSDDWKLSCKCKQPVMLSGAKHLWLFPLGGMHANQKNDLRFFSRDCGIRMTKPIYEMASNKPNGWDAPIRVRYRS